MSAAGRSSRRISEMSRSSVKRSAWLPRCSTPLVSSFVAPASYSYPSEASPRDVRCADASIPAVWEQAWPRPYSAFRLIPKKHRGREQEILQNDG